MSDGMSGSKIELLLLSSIPLFPQEQLWAVCLIYSSLVSHEWILAPRALWIILALVSQLEAP